MGILDYFDKSFKADDNKLKAILIYPNQDKSIKISDKSLVKEIKADQKDHKETITKTNEINTKSISNRYINIFVNLIKKETQKGFYFKAGRNNDRYYFAPKEICKWYGNNKRTLGVSLQNINKLGEYSYDCLLYTSRCV